MFRVTRAWGLSRDACLEVRFWVATRLPTNVVCDVYAGIAGADVWWGVTATTGGSEPANSRRSGGC